MFVADRLTYLELQKTGGSHICKLLEQHVNGRSAGKHNRVTTGIPDSYIIGSVRNPWEWYVSLWAYGVSGRGAIRNRSVKRADFNYYYRMLPKAMGKNWLTVGEFASSLVHDAVKPVRRWRASYRSSSDPLLFRAWLKLLLDPKRRFDIGEGYGFSPLSRHSGLMTYRYFRLYTTGNSIFSDRRLGSPETIAAYDSEMNITHGMIRNESLEDDFIRVVSDAGYSLTREQVESIRNREIGKTNVSRRQAAEFYYDDETAALVADRDRYLVSKYNYQPPLRE